MITINIDTNDDNTAGDAIAKVQDWLDKYGKWVFAWSQETKDIVSGSKCAEVCLAESMNCYKHIHDSGRSLFDYMNWAKTQGKSSLFVTFEDKLSCATYYASASDSRVVAQGSQSLREKIEVWAFRIDPLLLKAATSTIEYINNRVESVDKLYEVAKRKFYNLLAKSNVGDDLVAFLSEQDKEGLFVDGVRPQWYMFSTGKNSFARNLADSLEYDLTELQNGAIRNFNVAGSVNLPQLVDETIMKIKIRLPKSLADWRIELGYP